METPDPKKDLEFPNSFIKKRKKRGGNRKNVLITAENNYSSKQETSLPFYIAHTDLHASSNE
jgi:hypothetical protein